MQHTQQLRTAAVHLRIHLCLAMAVMTRRHLLDSHRHQQSQPAHYGPPLSKSRPAFSAPGTDAPTPEPLYASAADRLVDAPVEVGCCGWLA